MHARGPNGLAVAAVKAPRFLTSAFVIFLAGINPCLAQFEPEVYSASRVFNKVMSANPPHITEAVKLLMGYARPLHRQTLQSKWIDHLTANTTGAVKGQRKKLAELFDAFEESFAAGEAARKRAQEYIALRDELLGRATPKKEVEKSAEAFSKQLHELPEAQRSLLKEFGRQTKSRIKDQVPE